MSGPDLKEALRLVQTMGLAPLARSAAARPKTFFDQSGAYSRWQASDRETQQRVAEQLREHGASVWLDGEPVRVRFARVTGSSTMGLQPALKNWKAGAQKRLNGGAR